MTTTSHTGERSIDGLPEPGEVIANKYRIEGVIGRGGMGVVYRAQHELLREPVVLKVILSGTGTDDNARARFMREARASFQIKSDHVARVLDVDFLDSGRPFMVLEHLDGADLARVLAERPTPFESTEAVDIVLPVLEALTTAHAIGIIHRDLKPANLFVAKTPDGRARIKVLDFGIAKSTRSTDELTASKIALGTPRYMSPEQLRDTRSVDARTDLWSIGVILYELMTRALPFAGVDALSVYRSIQAGDPPSLIDRAPSVPPELAAVVARCLRSDPELRFPDASSLSRALLPFGSGRIDAAGAAIGDTATVATVEDSAVTAPSPVATETAATETSALASAAAAEPRPSRRRAAWIAAAITATLLMGGAISARSAGGKEPTPPVASASSAPVELEEVVDLQPQVSTVAPSPAAPVSTSLSSKPKARPRPRPATSFDPTAARKL